jgi:hypothetical protein
MYVVVNIHAGLNATKMLQRTTRLGGQNKSKQGYGKAVI